MKAHHCVRVGGEATINEDALTAEITDAAAAATIKATVKTPAEEAPWREHMPAYVNTDQLLWH